MLEMIRAESVPSCRGCHALSWIEANLEDPIAIQRVRAQLEAGLRQASLVKNVDDDDED